MYVCMSTFSNIFFSETTGPIEAKFHMKPPWDGGMKDCSNGPGHMTKMAAMPVCGKSLQKSSSPELKGLWPWKLVCSIGCSSTTNFVQMMTLGWPWPSLRQGQIWSLMLVYGEKGKTIDFSENIVVRQRNSMVSLRMCSIKMNTPRSHFWIGLHLSWMILLFLRMK